MKDNWDPCFLYRAELYLPGIGAHHHLLLKGGWQKQNPGLYYLSINRIDFPRGYASCNFF